MCVTSESLPAIAILMLDMSLEHLSRAQEAQTLQEAFEHIDHAKEQIEQILNAAKKIVSTRGNPLGE
jgi:hypothetical protein